MQSIFPLLYTLFSILTFFVDLHTQKRSCDMTFKMFCNSVCACGRLGSYEYATVCDGVRDRSLAEVYCNLRVEIYSCLEIDHTGARVPLRGLLTLTEVLPCIQRTTPRKYENICSHLMCFYKMNVKHLGGTPKYSDGEWFCLVRPCR